MKNNETFFGFKKVPSSEKTTLVKEVFSSVAKNYDLMNDIMSCGMHRLWKEEFIRQIPDFHGKLLDMASGTGDIAIKYYRRARKEGINPDITACDASEEMLKEGRDKALNLGITGIKYKVSFAEKLPFKDQVFDYYTVVFGIRNFTDIEGALKEAFRVLKPGGKFLCMEFSQIQNEFLEPVYNFYSMNIIPFFGKVIAKDEGAYRYLAESIRKFPNQEKFKNIISSAGFSDVKYDNLTFGTVTIHSAYKK